MTGRTFPVPPENIRADQEYLRQLHLVVKNNNSGKMNCVGEITLTANSSTTLLNNILLSINSLVLFMPLTANAASAYSGVYISSNTTKGQFTITHANDANTDKTFRYCIIG